MTTRFADNGDGTITDNKTGLMWSAETFGPMDWADAIEHCKRLTLARHTDWRLPTIEELTSIVDYTRYAPASDPVFGARSDFYWSSSTYVSGPQFAWGVYFGYGYVDANLKTTNYYVRAVRGVKPEVKP